MSGPVAGTVSVNTSRVPSRVTDVPCWTLGVLVSRVTSPVPSAACVKRLTHRAEEELASGGQPYRVDVDPAVEGRARQRTAGQIPQPDVYLLVGDVEGDARAVR